MNAICQKTSQTIISVHVPKCSGTSFKAWLEHTYGVDSIHWDYQDRLIDPTSEFNTDYEAFAARTQAITRLPEPKHVVHGHFWLTKYRNVPDALRLTFLRDAVDLLISHYYFWLSTQPGEHELHRQFLHMRPSILDFAKLPQLRFFYRDYMFRDVDMEIFDFIGDVATIDSDWPKLQALLGVSRPLSLTGGVRLHMS